MADSDFTISQLQEQFGLRLTEDLPRFPLSKAIMNNSI